MKKKYYYIGILIFILLIIGILIFSYQINRLKKQFYYDCVNKKIFVDNFFECTDDVYIYTYSFSNPQIVIFPNVNINGLYPIVQFQADIYSYFRDNNGGYNIDKSHIDFPIFKTYFFNDLKNISWNEAKIIFKNDFIANVLNKNINNKYVICESFFSSNNKKELLDCMKKTDLNFK